MFSILLICVFIIIKSSNDYKNKISDIFDNRKMDLTKRNLQEGTDGFSETYTINIENWTIEQGNLDLKIYSNDILPTNINFLARLKIEKYNISASNEININNFVYNVTKEAYSAFSNYLTLENSTLYMNVTILNISAYSNNIQYYVYFDNRTLNFINQNYAYNIESQTAPNNNSSDPNNDENSNENYPISGGGTSSSSVSIGLIIGLIAAVLAVIGIIIGIIIYCKKRKKVIQNESEINFEPKPNEDFRTLILTTQKQDKKTIIIKSDKNMKDLRKMFFETINQPELINEKSILFLYNGKAFNSNSNDLIKDIFKSNNGYNIVIIADNEDKINE